MDDLMVLTPANTVSHWEQAILQFLEQQPDKQASLLTLMSAARLQSRRTKHPFNDALSALLDAKRVFWSDVPGSPIRISIV